MARFTYRRGLERRRWHRPWLVRVALVALAVFVGLFGFVGWSLEQEKGRWEGGVLSGHFVVEDDGRNAVVRGERGEVLFEGRIEQVDRWIESQRHRDFTVPTLLLVGSGVLLAMGLGPSPRKRRRSSG